MRKITAFIALLLTMTACHSPAKTNETTRKITIGEYEFRFPKGFELIREKGIDSHVGKITNGNILFWFDYGYYSDPLDQPVSEYLSQDTWKWAALAKHHLLPTGDVTGISKEVKLISSLNKDGIHYTNWYVFRRDTLDYTLTVPETIVQTKIEADTIGMFAYKFVRRSDYTGLYVKNLSKLNTSINAFPTLSITANGLSKQEARIAYQILQSCKPRK